MKSSNLVILGAFASVFILTMASVKTTPAIASNSPDDSLALDRAKFVAQVRASIKGKEKMPADSVFKNIKIFKGVPAGRMLAIMDYGYGRSLGVSCGHCHNTNNWESEEKLQKQIAREMSALAKEVNGKLKTIQGLASETPVVNCTTCHRGSVKPALDFD